MKFPTKILCAGKKYNIIRKENDMGGSAKLMNQEINIGKEGKDDEQFDTFLHEVAEVILLERNYSYTNTGSWDDNGAIKFVFNHKEFQTFISDLAFAIQPLIKYKI